MIHKGIPVANIQYLKRDINVHVVKPSRIRTWLHGGFGDTLNVYIFVVSVGIFHREPFYFFLEIQDTIRYFRV